MYSPAGTDSLCMILVLLGALLHCGRDRQQKQLRNKLPWHHGVCVCAEATFHREICHKPISPRRIFLDS